MAKLILTPENQIQRLNRLLHRVSQFEKLPLDTLLKRPTPTSWNLLEVLEHLSISYDLYRDKIDAVLSESETDSEGPWTHKVGLWQTFVIEGQRPKGKKRPFKMKTLKRFAPLLPKTGMAVEDAKTVFERFSECHNTLKEQLLASRLKQLRRTRLTSAIGPIVRFYLPEAFEFLICHMERHMVQIDGILSTDG